MGVSIDMSGLQAWTQRMSEAARGGLKDDIAQWWDAEAMEFLTLVQNQITDKEIVDTRRLLNSFSKGADENVFEVSNGGLMIQVGTNVYYAKYVEGGHHTRGGGSFVLGRFYFEGATREFREQLQPEALAKVQQLINKYFGG